MCVNTDISCYEQIQVKKAFSNFKNSTPEKKKNHDS